MSFRDDLARFNKRIRVANNDVFINTASHAHESIVNGSAATGAPGQPVDTGRLRASWQLHFESPTKAVISTNVEYAEAVEDNLRNVKFKNHGPHSVKLTVAGLQRIVDVETAKAAHRG